MLVFMFLPALFELHVLCEVIFHFFSDGVCGLSVLVFEQVVGHFDLADVIFVLHFCVVVDDEGAYLPVGQDLETNPIDVVCVITCVLSSRSSSLRYFPLAIRSAEPLLVSVSVVTIWYTSPLTCPGS